MLVVWVVSIYILWEKRVVFLFDAATFRWIKPSAADDRFFARGENKSIVIIWV